jgi:hypothetical protein
MTHAEIKDAVSIIRRCSHLNDNELYRSLTVAGFDERTSARLVEFIPMAYCRVLLESTGVKFPDTFQRRNAGGTVTPLIPLASEPIWEAGLAYARIDVQNGITRDEKLQVAGRSAEFHAVNELLKKGTRLENIALIPAVLTWPEGGPEQELNTSRSAHGWWKVWR